jgi:hypothetical protein
MSAVWLHMLPHICTWIGCPRNKCRKLGRKYYRTGKKMIVHIHIHSSWNAVVRTMSIRRYSTKSKIRYLITNVTYAWKILNKYKTQLFRNWFCFRLQVRRRAQQSRLSKSVGDWFRLALSKGPNRVGVSLSSPEDGNKISFRNIVIYISLNSVWWTKSRNPVILTITFPIQQDNMDFPCLRW